MNDKSEAAGLAERNWCEGRDVWQNEIQARFPNGLTPAQFKALTLESGARHPERICCPPCIDGFKYHSMLTGMGLIDGTIERRGHGYNTPIEPYVITEKGRQALDRQP